ncbi:MAG: metallophosphoesterase family protein [Caldilineaceae bacterium]|nr:metallophosphoesterase family protein [Caldilineaceae bacterium]
MRVALLSDIHGNLFALEAVLAQLAREQIDQWVCLGDVAIFGPQPRETLARLQALGGPVVMGNTDAWALEPQPHPPRNEATEFFNAIELWGAAQLTAADRAYIRTFQATVELSLAPDLTLLCYHGSPRSYHDPIVATTPESELQTLLGTSPARILAGGHTHAPYVRRYREKLVLNPGSVGLPYETLANGKERNPPWAEYAVLDYDAGAININLRRVPYAVEPLLAVAQACGMPYAAWWSADWG